MSDQDNGQVSTLQRPTTEDPDAWKAYWEAKGWQWRTEPEIDAGRQKFLTERRAIVPDIEKGIYPFKDIKLCRADIEWLLAIHQSNGIRGPLDWNDTTQRERKGLDLRGTDLNGVDLSMLPLARTLFGLNWKEYQETTKEQFNRSKALLKNVNFSKTHLEGAFLIEADLEEADFSPDVDDEAYLEGAFLHYANLKQARMNGIHLEGTYLTGANLEGVAFNLSHLEGTLLHHANIDGANFYGVHFDASTGLHGVYLSSSESIADVHWNDTNLTVADWTQNKLLGDEKKARQTGDIYYYQRATRANRQLAVTLQSQGSNEEAAYFAYHAQLCQRIVLRLQKKLGQYLFSLFLDLLAGYGYRPGRSVLWYLAVIFGFALAYFLIGHLPFFPDAFVFSVTSFHGRGFFPGLDSEASLHNPLVVTAAFEAVVGLLIEISFIATFTQRFFGR